MSKIKRFALTVIASLAFATIGTASASATTDTGYLWINGGTPCAVEYDYSSTVPGSATLTNLVNPNTCPYAPSIDLFVSNPQSNLTLTFSGSSSAGTASLDGVFGLGFGGALFGCKFGTTASGGSGPLTGNYTGANFIVSTSLVLKTGSYGIFGCPGSISSLVNVAFAGTINP